MVGSANLLSTFDVERIAPEALLFQTGYLTIQAKESRGGRTRYRLGYPNREVFQSLNESLLAYLTRDPQRENHGDRLYDLLMAADVPALKDLFHAFFASIPYEWYTGNDVARFEGYYASVFYAYFASVLGTGVTVEDSSSRGRADMAVRAAAAAAVLHGDAGAQHGGEVGVEDAGVVALEAGDVVAGVPLVRDAGEEGVEQVLQRGDIGGHQQVVESVAVVLSLRVSGQVGEQALVQALEDLPVRVAEPIAGSPAARLLRLDGEVAGLEQQSLRRDPLHVERAQQVRAADHPVSALALDGMVGSANLLSTFDVERIAPEALLFQTGYLTIQAKESRGGRTRYRLGYPNREVFQSLNESLLAYLTRDPQRENHGDRLYDLLMAADVPALKDLFHAFFASIPYEWYTGNDVARFEGYYASVFYAYFASVLGTGVTVEDSSSRGRADMAVRAGGRVYLFEFKVVEQAGPGTALAQLKAKAYADKYRALGEPVHLVGVEFSSASRNVVAFDHEIA